jgi:hypothetical protein
VGDSAPTLRLPVPRLRSFDDVTESHMSGLQANIANFVRQEIRVPKSRPLLPVFEAVSNALDAIADRGGNGAVSITVLRQPNTLDGRRGEPHTFIVEDDGIGFTGDNIAAFDQLYSDRKMLQGGKGRGRFTFLKVFETVANRFYV